MRWIVLLAVVFGFSCFAAPPEGERQAGCLRAVLRQADDAYYNQHRSIMSDAAYDALRAQYDRLIEKYPELATASVGAQSATEGIAHSKLVLSLQKAWSDEEVEAFQKKCGAELDYCIEPKVDGLTIVLRYRNGWLSEAITRGDGKSGSDVTAPVWASGAVPVELKTGAPDRLELRGELFISHAAFNRLNERRLAAGEPKLKSPRNTAAGTLRLKDFSEIARRRLEFRAFELLDTPELPPTHSGALVLMKSCGLPVVESQNVEATKVLGAVEAMNLRRGELPFATDGVVVRVDDRAVYEKLGATARYPRGAVARKYRAVPLETKLLRVEWRRGATGRLTPVAHFEPLEFQGATVRSATLHSLNHLRAMDLMLGDWIQVVRAGGTTPEIVGVCPGRRTGKEVAIPAPAE